MNFEKLYVKAVNTVARLIDQSYRLEVRCEELEAENADLKSIIESLTSKDSEDSASDE